MNKSDDDNDDDNDDNYDEEDDDDILSVCYTLLHLLETTSRSQDIEVSSLFLQQKQSANRS